MPWKEIAPLRGQIETEFLRPLLLGESIAPFRILGTATAIIPWERGGLFGSKIAISRGHAHLASWLQKAEKIWDDHKANDLSLSAQLNYYGKLTSQIPVRGLRILYASSGTQPAAALIEDDRAIVEHSLYWMATNNVEEARYLMAILNSEVARKRTETLQSEGLFGPRHFDKYMFNLSIPRYSARDPVHRALAHEAVRAEQIAAGVNVADRKFQAARGAIRTALALAGVSQRIDQLVNQLLS